MDLNHCKEHCVLSPNHSAIRPFYVVMLSRCLQYLFLDNTTKIHRGWFVLVVQFIEYRWAR